MAQITGKEGGAISLARGAELTQEYQTNNPNATKAHLFGNDILKQIINQSGCMGMRMYYGTDPQTGSQELVLVGVDANGNDMTSGVIADLSLPCPTTCSSDNPLNGGGSSNSNR